MHDQAFNLRALMMQSALARPHRSGRPETWWLTAGKGGVGTTTMVVNLAAVLARRGRRVIAASTTEQPQDLELLCGLDQAEHIHAGTVRQGPAGMLILAPGSAFAGESRPQQLKLLNHALDNFHGGAELMIVDAGPRLDVATPLACNPEDMLLYVTTPDEVAVLDTYAALKQLVSRSAQPPCRLGILLNQTLHPRQGEKVFERVAETTRRFLNVELNLIGVVPFEKSLTPTRRSLLPVVLQSPTSPVARAIERTAVLASQQSQLR